MATEAEIERAFNIVLGAGLSFPPRADEIANRVDTWCDLLQDVPGDVLLKAARDIALNGEAFPSIPKIRKEAAEIKSRNGRAKETAFDTPTVSLMNPRTRKYLHFTDDQGNPYTEEVDVVDERYPVMVVTPEGWMPR